MSSFDNELNICLDLLESRISSTTDEKITPDVALILLNIWLAEKKDLIEGNGIEKTEEQVKTNIANLARQFPIVWNEKDTYNHVFPTFPKEDYIAYLSEINNSYKNLPIPNYTPKKFDFNKNELLITSSDVILMIHEKNNGKDHYGLTFKSLQKISSPRLFIFMTNCFNAILTGDFSLCQDWCSANICPRFKGGDKNDPKRFRPLMILPLFVRIFDSILSRKLHDVILKHNVIDTKVQKAIMKNSSGLWENVFEVNMKINEMLKEKSEKLFFFIDLNNAFGSVNYRTMLIILQKYNFSPELSSYFERYYKNVFGIYQKETFKWNNGIFQGSALSNIFFLLYIDFALKNIFIDLKMMKKINNDHDFQENTFAFVDDIVMILPKDEKVSGILKLTEKILMYYGLSINQNKTYFVIQDQSINELEYNGIIYKKASIDFKYLGHSLFIYQKEVFENIFERTKYCLETIDSFNIPNQLKAYIYYINVFLRINRIIECFYLINGKNELMDQIFDEISYFIYRWGVSDYGEYTRRHFEYMFEKGKAKLLKSPNLLEYHKMVEVLDIEKYGVDPHKPVDFTDIMEFQSPKLEVIEENLKTLKSNNYFPIEHYEKCQGDMYSSNFVAWVE